MADPFNTKEKVTKRAEVLVKRLGKGRESHVFEVAGFYQYRVHTRDSFVVLTASTNGRKPYIASININPYFEARNECPKLAVRQVMAKMRGYKSHVNSHASVIESLIKRSKVYS